MNTKKSNFFKFDQIIFNKIDQLLNDTNFQKMNEPYLALEENQKKIFAQALIFTLILIPYLIVVLIFWSNYNTKKRVEFKNQIIEQISIYNSNKENLNQATVNLLAPNVISSQEKLSEVLNTIASQNQIENQKISIVSFNTLNSSSTVSKIEAVIKIQNFGTKDLSNLLKNLIEIEKFNVVKIDFSKNLDNHLLEGNISLVHLGKANEI